MTNIEAVPRQPGGVERLAVRIGDGAWMADPGRDFVIGRGADADAVVTGADVSRRHAVLHHTNCGWELRDDSANGTYWNDSRVATLSIPEQRVVRLGRLGPQVELCPVPFGGRRSTGDAPSAVQTLRQRSVRIGRALDNDVVVEDLLVSRHHAMLARDEGAGGNWTVTDLGSDNGTFVNGRQIHSSSPLQSRDVLSVGFRRFRLAVDRLEEYVDTGDGWFAADHLNVTIEGRRLLEDVSFDIEGRTLLGIVGPSGAGKSTLLNALTGLRPAEAGSVNYAGRDLYSHYDELRNRMGFVPQQDVLHPQLTVRRALQYAAELRFPRDVSAEEQARRIDEVLDELSLSQHAEQRISTLSGGQRKRTSMALELLTKPSLLFLDEPTSGLDPGLDRSVMSTLRQLADGGRTVVVVTHNVANLGVCDYVLVLAPGGRVAFFGRPEDARAYFGVSDFADVFERIEADPRADWPERFLRSSYARPAAVRPSAAVGDALPGTGTAPERRRGVWSQFSTLSRRYLRVISADAQYVGFLAALPLALSLLAHAVPADAGLSLKQSQQLGDQRPQLLLVLILGACLMGTAASLREFVKERDIYQRERGIGLSSGAYVASKLVVLAGVVSVQAVVLAVLGTAGRAAPDHAVALPNARLEVVVAVLAVAVTSMLIGLLVSALVANADRTMPLLVLVVMAQLVLSGGFVPVAGRMILEQLAWFAPARWSFAAAASTSELAALPGSADEDARWQHSAGVWASDLAMLLVLSTVLAGLVIGALRNGELRRR